MAEQSTPLEAGTDLNQALRFHSRVRRRSLAGVVDLFRTHRFQGATTINVASIVTGDVFPDRRKEVTFQTAIRINAGTTEGMIFEFGDATTGCALWLQNNRMVFRAGGTANTSGAATLFSIPANWSTGHEFDVVAAIKPNLGMIRVWMNGTEALRLTASDGTFGVNGWASSDGGSFADAPNGGVPANIPGNAQVAPSNFEVIEPLSVYVGQTPRQFI